MSLSYSRFSQLDMNTQQKILELDAKNAKLRKFLREAAKMADIPMTRTSEVVLSSNSKAYSMRDAKERHHNLMGYYRAFLSHMDKEIAKLRGEMNPKDCSVTQAKRSYDLKVARAMRVYISMGGRCAIR